MSSNNEPAPSRSRRAEIRKNRPEGANPYWQKLQADGVLVSLTIAGMFFVIASGILLMRQDVIPFRPDQPVPHDIVSRVGFDYIDKGHLKELQWDAYEREPRVFRADPAVWDNLEKELVALPDKVTAGSREQLPDLIAILSHDPGASTALRHAASAEGRATYNREIEAYVTALRQFPTPLIILADQEREAERQAHRPIRIGQDLVDLTRTYSLSKTEDLRALLRPQAEILPTALQSVLVEYTLLNLKPTHVYDAEMSVQRCNQASSDVPASRAARRFAPNEIMVHRRSGRSFDQQDWQLMRAENEAYLASLKGSEWKPIVGTAFLVLIVTAVLCAYIAEYQPRVVRNHARALAIAALLLSMLLLAQLAGIGNGPIYLLGVAPTILVAMIIAIAYDQRFSIGVGGLHGLLVTVALSQGVTFFVIIWVGVLVASFMLDDIRTRSKLVEVGGATALAMIAAAAASGFLSYDSPTFVLKNSLYTGAAGLSVGFIVLGILPFVERAFRITTSMTLLEIADLNLPLLRRLKEEAPGTYNHSLQVATLSEAAAEAIGANALLCRVASYYHDVGKINKPDYFVENQSGAESRHLTLTPSMSLTIIKNHVKDGVALAREYNLPTSVIPFIEQHHGTTLIEYFYRRACIEQEQKQPGAVAPADHDFRYEGPKPRTRETGILMLADAVESATRAMDEPDYSRVERLVNELARARLLDGQYDECELSMADLERAKQSMIKTLMGIHHSRIHYASTAATTSAPVAETQVLTRAPRIA